MRSLRKLSALAAASLGTLTLVAPPASAVTGQWSNTVNWGTKTITVRYCSGGTGTIAGGHRTGRNVCAILLRYDREILAWVDESGTTLVDRANCGDDRWITFTSRTDTSRTAMVYYGDIGCA